MAHIVVLDQNTIDKIAAGEVIERPSSVVKELLENAIDAKASAITVEIRDGGTSLIRITDNGCGIEREDITRAFLPHATSKIRSIEDLITVSSLGFRGEALSSIAAVSSVELITKTPDSITGNRYQIQGGEEVSLEEIGAPDGTTFLVRNLFYNTPARRKFLKSAASEGAYVSDIVEKLALSHTDISFRLIVNNQNKIYSSGNSSLKDLIYSIYGRELAAQLIEVKKDRDLIRISGYVGKPVIARGSRSYENYFINGRFIKNKIITRAIEEAFRPYMMQHKYPFTMLMIRIEPEFLDVNVHPTKMEIRFSDNDMVFQAVNEALREALSGKDLVPRVKPVEEKTVEEKKTAVSPLSPRQAIPEPFEKVRRENYNQNSFEQKVPVPVAKKPETVLPEKEIRTAPEKENQKTKPVLPEPKQEELPLIKEPQVGFFETTKHRLIGQLFDTYWLIELEQQLFIIDQHAAHEKVLYEKTCRELKAKTVTSQMLAPPLILTLNDREQLALNTHMEDWTAMGFEIEAFGGREYAVRAVPDNLFSIAKKDLLIELLDQISDDNATMTSETMLDRIATMSCKAAVKGNHALSFAEADYLIGEMLKLENPFTCPHGRPTVISMSRYEIEKKFKRII